MCRNESMNNTICTQIVIIDFGGFTNLKGKEIFEQGVYSPFFSTKNKAL